MLGAGLLLLLAATPVPTPTTVNGQVLGTPEEFATAGPAKVCMRELALTVEEGETAYLEYAGIHSGTLVLVSGGLSVEFRHGEIWKRPKRQGRLVREAEGYRIFRTRSGRDLAYLLWVPDEGEDGYRKGEERPLIWILGSRLTGDSGDLAVFDRLELSRDGLKDCDRTYAYGWRMLFGEEPLSRKKDQ